MLNFRRLMRADPTIWRRSLSPILVRPVREQLEHDRIIRLLQAKFRRKYEAGMNPGDEQNAPVGTGAAGAVSRPRPVVAGARAQAAGRRRGRDRRVGQPPRSAGAVGALSAGFARPSTSTCRRAWSTSRGGSARTTRFTSPKSGAITSSATSRASRSSIAAARRRSAARSKPSAPRNRAAASPRPRRPKRPARAESQAREAGDARRNRKPPSRRPAPPRRRRAAPKAEEEVALAFLRFSRDKRGVRALLSRRSRRRTVAARCGSACSTGFARRPTSRSGASRSTQRVRRALEAQNPDVDFDWRAIVETPIPVGRRRQVARAPARGARRETRGAAERRGAAEPADAREPRRARRSRRRPDDRSPRAASAAPPQCPRRRRAAGKRRRRREPQAAPPTPARRRPRRDASAAAERIPRRRRPSAEPHGRLSASNAPLARSASASAAAIVAVALLAAGGRDATLAPRLLERRRAHSRASAPAAPVAFILIYARRGRRADSRRRC